ncbi:c-type cytochrome [Ramlibacter sp. AW1]|uniref:C-type cytochrome n=1 Tax=Ramlibacter aurantiacus TaxID=2801330 RepID=A0A936ZNV0_9BURK|nr:c-type cytochrome [Ramlibacter aurantiacus]MBL0420775.1 c-type cytochrome [Ramlibacter aurantiacus]
MNAPEARPPLTVRVRTLAIALLALVVCVVAGLVLVVQLGVYDVAATHQHLAPVYKLLHHAMARSVQARADQAPPADLDEPSRVEQGAVLYQGHCLQCHGAPGVPPEPFALGLRPKPVNLVPAAREWTAGEIFWTIKHGIKMTGMPGWKYRMADADIWSVVGFVRAMAVLSPNEYAAMMRRLPEHRHPMMASGETASAARQARAEPAAAQLPTSLGSVAEGRLKIDAFLCATCHVIPGVVGAGFHVGPPLAGVGQRAFIAGVVPNQPENLVRFLLNPPAVAPGTAMPPLGLSEEDARDIAAFLYTLRTP